MLPRRARASAAPIVGGARTHRQGAADRQSRRHAPARRAGDRRDARTRSTRCRRPRPARVRRLVDDAGRRARRMPGARRRPAGRRAAPSCWRCCVREAGKTIPDAWPRCARRSISCATTRRARRADFAAPLRAARPDRRAQPARSCTAAACSPASRRGISRWRSSLGQVSAALAAGNTVVAKPAEQTPLIAALAVRLLHEAGVPADVLHLLPGDGPASARRWSPIRASPASPSPARPRPRAPSTARSPRENGADRAADRRDRRPERDDRRFLRAAGAGGARRADLLVPERRASAAPRCACCSCRRTSPTS